MFLSTHNRSIVAWYRLWWGSTFYPYIIDIICIWSTHCMIFRSGKRLPKTCLFLPTQWYILKKRNHCNKVDLHWDYIMMFIFEDSLIRTTCRSWGFSDQTVRYIEVRHIIWWSEYSSWCIIHIHIGTCWKPRFHNAKCGSKACSPRFNCSKGLRTSQPKRFSWNRSQRAYKSCVLAWVQQECPWHSTSRPPHELVWSCSSGLVSSPNTLLPSYHGNPMINIGWGSLLVMVFRCIGHGWAWHGCRDNAHSQGVINKQHEALECHRKITTANTRVAQPHLQCATKVTHQLVASCHTHSTGQLAHCSPPNPPGTCFLKARSIWSFWSDHNQLQLGGVHPLM